MKLKALLSVLLIVAMLLTPVALMEESIEKKFKSDGDASIEETIEETPVNEDNAAANDTEEHMPEGEILPENVDMIVAEETGAEMDEEFSAMTTDIHIAFDEAHGTQEFEQEFEVEKEKTPELLMAASSNIAIDSINFPDKTFRQYVLDIIDTDPKDAFLSSKEIKNVYEIGIGSRYSNKYVSIESLKGIEYFSELGELKCPNCDLTSLDVSKNTKLNILDCSENHLNQLDISGCRDLVDLNCALNSLKSLDISNCPNLCDSVKKGGPTSFYGGDFVYGNGEGVLCCDSYVEIILEKSASAVADISSVSVPEVTSTPTIAAMKKAGKQKISAAPGSVYQLDLGGATGKKFKSSKKKVATVDGNGLVTVKAAGKTKITFKVGKKKRTVTLTVKDPTIPGSVTLSQSGTVAVKVGETTSLTATIPEGTNSGIKWKSSNKKVAAVDQNGNVTFKKKGKVTITATATRGKKKAKVKFKVSK